MLHHPKLWHDLGGVQLTAPSVISLKSRCVRVLDALRIDDQERAAGVATQFLAGRANLIFFKACSSRLPPSRCSLQITKYECTVRHLENSLDSMRHWQPLLSRYSTAKNTSYSSTGLGLVFLRALSSNGLMFWKLFSTG